MVVERQFRGMLSLHYKGRSSYEFVRALSVEVEDHNCKLYYKQDVCYLDTKCYCLDCESNSLVMD